MPTLSHSCLIRAMAMGAIVLLGLATLGSDPLAAQVLESDITGDSEIELLEQAESGAYQRYWIKVSTREGRSVLAIDKDGVKAEFGITPDDCLALWREVLKNNLETLVNASAQDASPDQSQFTVKYRVWQTAGGFSADGVDSLPDDRYRKIVRAILTVADRYLRTGGR
ncbi:MAG: hypothetical protein DMF89_17550 [Acidobacteria bacterium]|nr:MAG: hypothetical protein DMF89_17550 [Acidobacteriota bacterium]